MRIGIDMAITAPLISSAAPYSITDEPEVLFYLNADLGVVTPGGNVTSWTDRKATASNAVAGTPTHDAANVNFNGRGRVAFPTTAENMNWDAIASAIVGGVNKSHSGFGLYRFTSDANYTLWGFGNSGVTVQEVRLRLIAGRTLTYARIDDASGAANVPGSTALVLNTLYLIYWENTGATFTLVSNGTTHTGMNAAAVGSLGALTASKFALGKRTNSGSVNGFVGEYGDQVHCTGVMSTAAKNRVKNALATKYGVAFADF